MKSKNPSSRPATKRPTTKLTTAQWSAIGLIGAALMTGLFGTINLIIDRMPTPTARLTATLTAAPSVTVSPVPSDTLTPFPTLTRTSSPSPAPTLPPSPTPLTGLNPGNADTLSVSTLYDPSGHMGDTGDVTIGKQPTRVIFTYETLGRGPHEWDYTYINDALNPKPAFFAGVLLLEPPNCWGTLLNCGYDLRGFKKLRWEARSLGEDVYVEFIIGGVVWQWDLATKTRVAVPYPESLPRISLGVKLLTKQTQSFEHDISYLPEEALRKVIGGFGWVITWDANGVKRDASGTGPVEAKTFVIEVSKIEYVR